MILANFMRYLIYFTSFKLAEILQLLDVSMMVFIWIVCLMVTMMVVVHKVYLMVVMRGSV